MEQEARRILINDESYQKVKNRLKADIPMHWNEYELSTIALVIMCCFLLKDKETGLLPLHVELYAVVARELACTPSTIQNRVKRVKDKFFEQPVAKSILSMFALNSNQILTDMFYRILMDMLSDMKSELGVN